MNSESQVNLDNAVLVQINKNLKQLLSKTMPNMESIFVTAQNDIEKLIATDIYPRFVRHQMTMSATRALATNVNKYGGLGDAFVLTNPNKADNPIVYASDGFVKVTGFKRNEIIPRNCRFLQTRQTDRESVKRIKMSLDHPAECVELLLNERKNGEPFWNLLYTGKSAISTLAESLCNSSSTFVSPEWQIGILPRRSSQRIDNRSQHFRYSSHTIEQQ